MTFLVYPSPAPSDLAVNLISDSVFVIPRSVCRATSSPALPISRPLMVTATSVPHLGWLGTWLTPVTSPRRTIATVALNPPVRWGNLMILSSRPALASARSMVMKPIPFVLPAATKVTPIFCYASAVRSVKSMRLRTTVRRAVPPRRIFGLVLSGTLWQAWLIGSFHRNPSPVESGHSWADAGVPDPPMTRAVRTSPSARMHRSIYLTVKVPTADHGAACPQFTARTFHL